MIRRTLVLAVVSVVAGCSTPDPASSLLAPGTMMMAYRAESKEKLYPAGRVPIELSQGVALRVARDDGPEIDSGREVHAVITEGPYQGEAVRISRNQLRPLKN